MDIHAALYLFFFFFNDTATTEIYTLSLHDALPIWFTSSGCTTPTKASWTIFCAASANTPCGFSRSMASATRSEEHTSELQSRLHLVCRLLLEKKKPAKRVTDSRLVLLYASRFLPRT